MMKLGVAPEVLIKTTLARRLIVWPSNPALLDTHMNFATPRRVLMWLLLFSCMFLFVVLGTSRAINVYDESLILERGNRVANRAFPHRDCFIYYAPAQFFVIAFFFQIFLTTV